MERVLLLPLLPRHVIPSVAKTPLYWLLVKKIMHVHTSPNLIRLFFSWCHYWVVNMVVFSKAHSIWMMEHLVRLLNTVISIHLLQFFYCKVGSLVRSNSMWDILDWRRHPVCLRILFEASLWARKTNLYAEWVCVSTQVNYYWFCYQRGTT